MDLQTKIYYAGTEDVMRSPLTDNDFLQLVADEFKTKYGILCGANQDRVKTTVVAVFTLDEEGEIPTSKAIYQSRFDINKITKTAERCLVVRRPTPSELKPPRYSMHAAVPKYHWVIGLYRGGEYLGGTNINLTQRANVVGILSEFILNDRVPGNAPASMQAQGASVVDQETLNQVMKEKLFVSAGGAGPVTNDTEPSGDAPQAQSAEVMIEGSQQG